MTNGSCDEIIGLLARLEAIDAELWEQKVIWCQNFADGIAEAYRNRAVEMPQRPSFPCKKPRATDVSTAETCKKSADEMKLDEMKSDEMSITALFDAFWQAYPKKKSKGQAEKAFLKVKPDEQLLATMLATIERAKKSEDWLKDDGKYIPYPATWLSAKGWEDEYKEAKNGAYRGNPSQKPSGAFDGLDHS